MHVKTPWSGSMRAWLVAIFALGIVLSVQPPVYAQGKEAGGMGGGGGGGRRGGSKGSDAKKERPKRNEQAAVDPQVARDKLQTALIAAWTRGTGSTAYLANLFDQASTQALPASSGARKALADALAIPLKGTKLQPDNAAAIAEPVAAAVNGDGIEPADLEAKKDPLKQALTGAGINDEQCTVVLMAFDRVLADQQNSAARKVSEDLEMIQKEGQAGDDVKQTLSADIAALVGERGPPPDPDLLAKLSEHVVKGLDAAQLTNKERAQLAYDLQLILTRMAATPAEMNQLLGGVRTVLKAGLVKQGDIQSIVADLQAIHKASAAAPATPATAPADEAAESAEK